MSPSGQPAGSGLHLMICNNSLILLAAAILLNNMSHSYILYKPPNAHSGTKQLKYKIKNVHIGGTLYVFSQ